MNYAYGFQDQGPDPNSPGTFKQNIQITLEYIATLREHVRQALAGIQNAYHIGRNPSQTQDDIAAAKQTLDIIIDLMERSGVGALPLLDIDTSGRVQIPTEEQLVETATKRVQVNFEKLKRAQESAAVVTNLLTTEHRPQKNPSGP